MRPSSQLVTLGPMSDPAICPRCELPVGAYEPFVWQMPNGSLVDCGAVPYGSDAEATLDAEGKRLRRECASA